MSGLRRLGHYVFVIWAAATINFLLPRIAPGDPINYLHGSDHGAMAPEVHQQMLKEFGLDGTLMQQYGRYWVQMFRGDLGMSTTFRRPVTSVLLDRIPWTLALVGIATILSALIGTAVGVAAARRRGQRRDVGLVTGLVFLDAMPGFWIAMLLVAVFSVRLGWFPSFGAVPLDAAGGFAWFAAVAHRLVLPVTTIVLATVGQHFLLARGAMVNELSQPYTLLGAAKGLSPRRIAYRRALRNALLPISTSFFLSLGAVVSGAVVVESIFAYPGIGQAIYSAVTTRDYRLLQGAFLVVTISVVTANLVADLLYPLLDPRVRVSRSGPVKAGSATSQLELATS